MCTMRLTRPTTARPSSSEVPSGGSAGEPSEELLETPHQQRGAQAQQPQGEAGAESPGSIEGPTEKEEDDAWDSQSPRSGRATDGRYHGSTPSTQFHTTTPRTHREGGGGGFLTRRAAAEARRRGTVALLSTAAQTARVLRQSQVCSCP